ncbi:MAG: oligopeptide/dipeptide ABC transporter ATP-binding protein [Promethearchaeota archaeon]
MLKSETPTPVKLPQGCQFKPRCQEVGAYCKPDEPTLHEVAPGHYVACYIQ